MTEKLQTTKSGGGASSNRRGNKDYAKLQGMHSRERMQIFCKRMKEELGYRHAYGWEIYSKEKGGKVMYHMIHATDHDEGPKIMNRVYRNALNDREESAPTTKRFVRSLGKFWQRR